MPKLLLLLGREVPRSPRKELGEGIGYSFLTRKFLSIDFREGDMVLTISIVGRKVKEFSASFVFIVTYLLCFVLFL